MNVESRGLQIVTLCRRNLVIWRHHSVGVVVDQEQQFRRANLYLVGRPDLTGEVPFIALEYTLKKKKTSLY